MSAIPNVTLKRLLCDKGERSYPFCIPGPCLRHNTGGKFYLPKPILSKDIHDFMICLHDVTTGTKEGIAKLKTPTFLILKSLSNKLNLSSTS